MIKLDNSIEEPKNSFKKANTIISAVKTGGSVLLAVIALGGFAAKLVPGIKKTAKKN